MNRLFDAVTFGPARRRRNMNKQLAQLTEAYRSGSSFAPPPGRASRDQVSAASNARLLLLLTLIVAAVAGSVIAARSLAHRAPAASVGPTGPTGVPTRAASAAPASPGAGGARINGTELPPSGVDSSPNRILPAVPARSGSGGFAITRRDPQNGAPVGYDPCRPIHYRVRDDGTPPGGDAVIRESVAAVSAATGLAFVDDGSTVEAPSDARRAFQPDRYGQRWAPVLIAWSNPAETKELAGSVTGTGGSQAVTLTINGVSQIAYVTGSIALDAPQLQRTAATEGSTAVRAVVEHELGHLVGLDHVKDRQQLMYPESALAVTRYQSGDLRGLALLGNGPCTPTL
ncbi:MAG TPA: matrixin family metalloprotease [Frankiaceae bacterium]|nr:matrixin family metalloprotease [Frankiaceae bacterium]